MIRANSCLKGISTFVIQALQMAEKLFLPGLRQPIWWLRRSQKKIFPRCGMPKVIGSNGGPVFVTQVRHGMAKTMGIN